MLESRKKDVGMIGETANNWDEVIKVAEEFYKKPDGGGGW